MRELVVKKGMEITVMYLIALRRYPTAHNLLVRHVLCRSETVHLNGIFGHFYTIDFDPNVELLVGEHDVELTDGKTHGVL
jgi:hypothetical protein